MRVLVAALCCSFLDWETAAFVVSEFAQMFSVVASRLRKEFFFPCAVVELKTGANSARLKFIEEAWKTQGCRLLLDICF